MPRKSDEGDGLSNPTVTPPTGTSRPNWEAVSDNDPGSESPVRKSAPAWADISEEPVAAQAPTKSSKPSWADAPPEDTPPEVSAGEAPAPPETANMGGIKVGQMIGQYKVEGLLGRGGMGVVYKGHHEALDRYVAIKLMSGLAPDRAAADRFMREGRAVSKMRHPNVLAVFDYGEVDGVPFMITEFMSGGSLSDLLGTGPMDPKEAIRYLRGIGSGIDYAHETQIIHRDIKPSNVLLSGDGEAILADFGLAKFLSNQSQRSQSGFISGTVAYMAPEQASELPVGPAADIYSFAIMAFELIAGQLPFPGENVLDVLLSQIQKQPPAPSTINPKLSSEVDSVILRGLAKEPKERWTSCGQMVTALEEAFTHAPVVRSAGATIIHRTVTGIRVRTAKRPWLLWAGGAAAAALVLGTVGAMTVGKSVFHIGTQPVASTSPGGGAGTGVTLPGATPGGGAHATPKPKASPSGGGTPGVTPGATPVAPGASPGTLPGGNPAPTPTTDPGPTPTADPGNNPNPTPTQPQPTPTQAAQPISSVNVSGNSACPKVGCTFTASVSGGSGNFTYTWSALNPGAGGSIAGPNSSSWSPSFPSTGQWVVKLIVTDNPTGQQMNAPNKGVSVS